MSEVIRFLYEGDTTVKNGEVFRHFGDRYEVIDVSGKVIKEGKVWRIDTDLLGMSKEALQMEVMRLRTGNPNLGERS